MADADNFMTTVHIKPFFHTHHAWPLGSITNIMLEFMNMPELGFFLRVHKGEQMLRMHYSVAAWIMDLESNMGNFAPIDDEPNPVMVTQNRFRLYYPLHGYVTTVTPVEAGPDAVWQEIVIEEHDDRCCGKAGCDAAANEIHLTRYEFGQLKKMMPVMTGLCEQAKERAETSGLNIVGKLVDIKCELCDHFMKCANNGLEVEDDSDEMEDTSKQASN